MLLICATYLGLADGDINVPESVEIRRQLDRYGVSVFRPVASREDVVRKASQIQNELRQHLVKALVKGELKLNRDSADFVWSIGQVASAIYRDTVSTTEEIRLLTPLFDRVFEDDFPLKLNGKLVGWRGDGGLPRVETALWIMMALTYALKREDEEIEAIRPRYVRYLETVQEIAEIYHPLRDGGWNTVIQDKREDRSVYSSAFALHALLELQSAKLCCRRNCEQLQIMIKETSRWLIQAYVDDKSLNGWRYSSSDETPPNHDLSLFVYGVLARSPAPIPENIEKAALEALSNLRFRPYHPESSRDPSFSDLHE